MDAATPKKELNSRWDRNPRLEDGKPVVAQITERDVEIFKLLARHRYLPADYIHAFIGGHYHSLIRRLDLLQRAPNQYLRRPEQQRENADANYRKLVYELDERAIRYLNENGFAVKKRKYQGHFAHELMVCQIEASLELGAVGRKDVFLIRWPAILASDQFPEATRNSPNPIAIPVGDHYRTPDGEPCVIALQKETTAYSFLVKEADCGTEPMDASNDERSSVRRMFDDYLSILHNKTHLDHYGSSTFLVAIVTTSEVRMRSMMDLLERMIEEREYPRRHAKRFLFKHMPKFTDRQTTPATGHMLTEPWQRACGFPEFHLAH